jgi:lipopolysaccharide transport system ATP-binding protein
MGIITVSNLGKAYKQYPNRWSRLLEWADPFDTCRHTLKWVLQDINFTVRPGEAVGIIGINGAGKSTLLKMIAGITQPTTGSVNITGRLAALLELGTGFHPDFTGRQNALMAGQLLGYTAEDIRRLMPGIEAFAEIGDYIDQPVRVYSSGMQIRLAFSVATAQRPDVLILDEALSVGDAYFQHKSLERIRVLRRAGTTLLMVSHDQQAIRAVCDRGILLNAGKISIAAEPEAVMDYYNALLASREGQGVSQTRVDGRMKTISGGGEASIERVALENDRGQPVETIGVGAPVTLCVSAVVNRHVSRLVLGYIIKDRVGNPVYGTNTHHLGRALEALLPDQRVECRFHFNANLGVGSYSIAVALHGGSSHLDENYEWHDMALHFNVINMGESKFVGVAWLPPRLEVRS